MALGWTYPLPPLSSGGGLSMNNTHDFYFRFEHVKR